MLFCCGGKPISWLYWAGLYSLIISVTGALAPESPEPRLTPAEREIVLHPFPCPSARELIQKRVDGALIKHKFASLLPFQPRSMGWTFPDDEYWRRIPEAARTFPANWSRIPSVRYTNSEIGGVREVRLIRGKEFDQWLLSDPLHRLTAFISIRRVTREVYFGEITFDHGKTWRLDATFDRCYSCHPSGPRVIRPMSVTGVNTRTLAAFNTKILSYGACNFGDSVSDETRGDEIGNT